jgi:FixJ family two-component response regulator
VRKRDASTRERHSTDAWLTLTATRMKSKVRVVAARNVVYVVDDDAGMLKGIERLLKASGFDAEVFESAEDFHDRANPSNGLCLVLDVQLGGMSGIELSRLLVKRGSALPVIFISANDNDTTRKATRDAGCVAYLPKPFPAKSLIDAIERASAQRRNWN